MITTKIYIQTRRRNRRNSATNKVNIRHVNNIRIIMDRITRTFSITNSYVIASYWYKKKTQTDSHSNYKTSIKQWQFELGKENSDLLTT